MQKYWHPRCIRCFGGQNHDPPHVGNATRWHTKNAYLSITLEGSFMKALASREDKTSSSMITSNSPHGLTRWCPR